MERKPTEIPYWIGAGIGLVLWLFWLYPAALLIVAAIILIMVLTV